MCSHSRFEFRSRWMLSPKLTVIINKLMNLWLGCCCYCLWFNKLSHLGLLYVPCETCRYHTLYILLQFQRQSQNTSDVFDYIIVITSFVVTWIETWFLDFRVLPKERAAREGKGSGLSLSSNPCFAMKLKKKWRFEEIDDGNYFDWWMKWKVSLCDEKWTT